MYDYASSKTIYSVQFSDSYHITSQFHPIVFTYLPQSKWRDILWSGHYNELVFKAFNRKKPIENQTIVVSANLFQHFRQYSIKRPFSVFLDDFPKWFENWNIYFQGSLWLKWTDFLLVGFFVLSFLFWN